MHHLFDPCQNSSLCTARNLLRTSYVHPRPTIIFLPGVVSFDNIGNAVLTMFVGITLEGWTGVMYLLQDSLGWIPATIFMVRCQHLNLRTSTCHGTN